MNRANQSKKEGGEIPMLFRRICSIVGFFGGLYGVAFATQLEGGWLFFLGLIGLAVMIWSVWKFPVSGEKKTIPPPPSPEFD